MIGGGAASLPPAVTIWIAAGKSKAFSPCPRGHHGFWRIELGLALGMIGRGIMLQTVLSIP
jgi:hypothetical protein